MTDDASDKTGLRARMRVARAAIPEGQRREATIRVAAGVLLYLQGVTPLGVLAYCASPEEIDPSVLVRLLRESGVPVAFPRVCGPAGLALHWSELEDLQPGYCGLLEPTEGMAEAAPDEIDVVLVPGVAFDERGHRLGMGGGFYDRLLADLPPEVMKIGLAFDEQIVEAVPREEHDVVLDAVVTPSRILRPGKAPEDRP
jgi:5-formyltetrahydrofolate cyclo-ligase